MQRKELLYVAKGQLKLKDKVINQYDMVVLSEAEGVVIEATQNSRIALIGGKT